MVISTSCELLLERRFREFTSCFPRNDGLKGVILGAFYGLKQSTIQYHNQPSFFGALCSGWYALLRSVPRAHIGSLSPHSPPSVRNDIIFTIDKISKFKIL